MISIPLIGKVIHFEGLLLSFLFGALFSGGITPLVDNFSIGIFDTFIDFQNFLCSNYFFFRYTKKGRKAGRIWSTGAMIYNLCEFFPIPIFLKWTNPVAICTIFNSCNNRIIEKVKL